MKITIVILVLVLLGVVVGQSQAVSPPLMGIKLYVPIVAQEPVDRADVLDWLNANSYYHCSATVNDAVMCWDKRSQFDLPFEATLEVDAVHHYLLYTDRTLLQGCYPWGLCRQEWPFQ